jgi:hypothetical protein
MSFNIDDFLKQVEENQHPELRYGQILFITLYKMSPKLANKINGTHIDPFHANEGESITRFFEFLHNIGEEE